MRCWPGERLVYVALQWFVGATVSTPLTHCAVWRWTNRARVRLIIRDIERRRAAGEWGEED